MSSKQSKYKKRLIKLKEICILLSTIISAKKWVWTIHKWLKIKKYLRILVKYCTNKSLKLKTNKSNYNKFKIKLNKINNKRNNLWPILNQDKLAKWCISNSSLHNRSTLTNFQITWQPRLNSTRSNSNSQNQRNNK